MSGIFEGVALANGDVSRYAACNLTMAEEAAAVDRFYQEADNLPVPVSVALLVVVMKANGETPDAVENFTAAVKRAILNPPASAH